MALEFSSEVIKYKPFSITAKTAADLVVLYNIAVAGYYQAHSGSLEEGEAELLMKAIEAHAAAYDVTIGLKAGQ